MGLDYWNWLYNKMKGNEMEDNREAQPFGSIGTPGLKMKIELNQDISISGSDGKWENTITLQDLPWLLGKLNGTATQELQTALQKIINDFIKG